LDRRYAEKYSSEKWQLTQFGGGTMKIILASGSPRRKELVKEVLDKYGMEFEIQVSEIDESVLKQTIFEPSKLVEEISYIKAMEIYGLNKDRYDELIVIGGDTIVYFNGGFLGKPENEEHAKDMLQQLSGNVNEVYTGMTVVIKRNESVTIKKVHTRAEVYMKEMSDDDIAEYIATKEPLDKAGAYAIQGIGSKYIEKYVGEFNTIVGLSTRELEDILKEM